MYWRLNSDNINKISEIAKYRTWDSDVVFLDFGDDKQDTYPQLTSLLMCVLRLFWCSAAVWNYQSEQGLFSGQYIYQIMIFYMISCNILWSFVDSMTPNNKTAKSIVALAVPKVADSRSPSNSLCRSPAPAGPGDLQSEPRTHHQTRFVGLQGLPEIWTWFLAGLGDLQSEPRTHHQTRFAGLQGLAK